MSERRTNRKKVTRKPGPVLISLLLLVALIAAGCTATLDAANAPTPDVDHAVQLSEEVQRYIDLSRADLAQRLHISPEQIALESVTEPAATEGTYIVKLVVGAELYEYHGRNGEALLVSQLLPQAPGQFTFAPAVVDSVEVQIDESAPAPVSVIVRGNLPDNCTEIHEGLVDQVDEHTFAISLSTRRPAGRSCGEVLVPYETAVSLGVEVSELPAGEYTVVVNDQVTEAFTLDLDALNSLPFLPFFNAQSMMHTRGEYFSFRNGSGIRYLTQFGQAAGPIHNRELLYTFQGLTDDGAYYVAAVFPVAQADLPADIASADTSFPDGFEAYIQGMKAALAAADPASFTPNLETLDGMVTTITLQIPGRCSPWI